MAELQRSAISFRRQGSSGLVWDDRFLSGDLREPRGEEPRFFSGELRKSNRAQQPAFPIHHEELRLRPTRTERSAITGRGGEGRRAAISHENDPPSPKLSACGCCGGFGKSPRSARPNRPVKAPITGVRDLRRRLTRKRQMASCLGNTKEPGAAGLSDRKAVATTTKSGSAGGDQ
ncbi:hypothetical protein Ancab_012018 [Ancistrocladus abbreviatus]